MIILIMSLGQESFEELPGTASLRQKVEDDFDPKCRAVCIPALLFIMLEETGDLLALVFIRKEHKQEIKESREGAWTDLH